MSMRKALLPTLIHGRVAAVARQQAAKLCVGQAQLDAPADN